MKNFLDDYFQHGDKKHIFCPNCWTWTIFPFCATECQCPNCGENLMQTYIRKQLPQEYGFYWWRESPERKWFMVRIADLEMPDGDKRHDLIYEVNRLFSYSRAAWEEYKEVGEWVPILEPEG